MIGGLTYNFLPFMILPIYVSLEKIDLRLTDAAEDLYNNGWQAFRKVVLPLSLPGVFAGSLLMFIPAAGDFINAEFLGGPKTTMIGTVVQNQFLVQGDYPDRGGAVASSSWSSSRSACSIYARVLGTGRPASDGRATVVDAPETDAPAALGSVERSPPCAVRGLRLPVPADRRDRRRSRSTSRRGKFNIIWQEFTLDNWTDPFAAGPLTDAMVRVAEGRGASRRSSRRSSAR